ncbi:MAG: tetratricopeptide repeat protein [Faecalibacterium sp.]
MANGTWIKGRLRPAGGAKPPRVLEYSPTGTGCPAVEKAVSGLYRQQSEESFWTLMSALNYAMQIDTRILIPVQTAPTVLGGPAPWTEHPIPEERADGLPLWTLRTDKSRVWLPVFTSSAAAAADRSTAARPMVEKTLQSAMEFALNSEEINGVVINPWTGSATLDSSLLRGLLRAEHSLDGPGEQALENGRAAARAGRWIEAAHHFEEAAQQGSASGLEWLGRCCYKGLGVRRSRTEARRMWKQAAEAGDARALIALGDDCAAQKGAAKALLYYRQAQQLADAQPDVQHTPYVCLRMAQAETQHVSPRRALALAAEAEQGFQALLREKEPDAERWLAEAQALGRALSGAQAKTAAYNIES